MTLHVYDLDKTLINGDSNELWHEYMQEKDYITKDFIKEDKRLMALYAQGKLNMDEYLEFALTALKALSIKQIASLMDEFLKTKIAPIVHQEAIKLINKTPQALIISATPQFIVKEVAHFLGIKEAIGMQLIAKNGYLTNEYEKPLSYKEGKVKCLKNWLTCKNIEPKKIVFYTDSINDLPLCEFADEVHCVNPDEQLEKIAHNQQWQIHNWGK